MCDASTLQYKKVAGSLSNQDSCASAFNRLWGDELILWVSETGFHWPVTLICNNVPDLLWPLLYFAKNLSEDFCVGQKRGKRECFLCFTDANVYN